jgi:hypothetical protein
MLKKTQPLVIALAVFALFAACQKDELPPVNEDPEVPELPQDPVIPKWEKIDGIPEGNFVSLAVINGQVLALDNQNLYRINPENWSFTKKSFENPNFPNVTKTPISQEFFAAIKGSEIVVFSSLFPQAKGKIDVNEFLEGDYSIIAAYSHAPKDLAISQENRFLFVFVGNDPGNINILYLVSFKAQMAPVNRVEFRDVQINKLDDMISLGNYNLIYPAGDNFIFSQGARTFLVAANGNWKEIVMAPILSIIPFNDQLIGFGQPSGNVWLSDIDGEDWTRFNWGLTSTPYLINPKGIQIEDQLIQEVFGGLALVKPGLSGKPFNFRVFRKEQMELPGVIQINDFVLTENHVVMATNKGIYISPVEGFLQK